MKRVLRNKDNAKYWNDRWLASGIDDKGFKALDIYPIKYSEKIMAPLNRVLEAGCGPGRLLLHYGASGKEMHGLEYSQVAVDNLLAQYPNAKVKQGSIADLPYPDGYFEGILAFGLYHNLEHLEVIKKAFLETARVLKSGGKLVLSVRHDSLENRIVEYVVKSRAKNEKWDQFHRTHFTYSEIKAFLLNAGLSINSVEYAKNVSFLFKFQIFRHKDVKGSRFNEREARSLGFRLNWFGKAIDSFLYKYFPNQFSNLLVVYAEKMK